MRFEGGKHKRGYDAGHRERIAAPGRRCLHPSAGARSITGPYLRMLGFTATTIGIVPGFWRVRRLAVRLGSGHLADRRGRYWAVAIFGYLLNLFAAPLLEPSGSWQIAVVLIIAERMGPSGPTRRLAMRCCRTPPAGPGSAGALAFTRRSIRPVPWLSRWPSAGFCFWAMTIVRLLPCFSLWRFCRFRWSSRLACRFRGRMISICRRR